MNKRPTSTRQDEEDSGNEGQDGAMRTDVADVTEHKPDEHEDEADQRERCGRADHLCKESRESAQVNQCDMWLVS